MIMAEPEFMDMELELAGRPGEYSVTVVSSPAGEARGQLGLPDHTTLESQLKDLQIAILRGRGGARRVLSEGEKTVQSFGQDLLSALLPDAVRTCFDVSLMEARRQGKRLRMRMRIQPPELAALPWEFLYDGRQGEFICLSRSVSLVRYLEQAIPVTPLTLTPPLRILAMAVSPSDLPPLDVQAERKRLDDAAQQPDALGRFEVTWLSGGGWRDLQDAMLGGPWHIFHFIGHGDFDTSSEEGLVAFADETGRSNLLSATALGRLLADHPPLRLAVLNSCEGAVGDRSDPFSSTAATLVRRGIPAVLAMQYEISDGAAIEFSRTFYRVLARGQPVDAAVGEARIAISMATARTVEWGTPVLFMRSPDGRLFDLAGAPAVVPPPVKLPEPPTEPPVAPRPVATRAVDLAVKEPAPPPPKPVVRFNRLLTLNGHGGRTKSLLGGGVPAVHAVAFAPGGQALVSGGSDRTVRVWRTSDGQPIKVIAGLPGEVNCVAWSPDGGLIAAGCLQPGRAAGVYLWRTSDWAPRFQDAGGLNVHSLAFTPDGSRLAFGCNNGTVYVLRTLDFGYERSIQSPTSESLSYSPDGSLLASASTFDSAVRVWKLADRSQALTLPARGANEVAFSPDGKVLAWSGSEGQVVVCRLPDGATVERLPQTPVPLVGINALAFSASGSLVIAASSDLRLHAWGVDGGWDAGAATLVGMWMGGVRSLAAASGGRQLAIAGGGPLLQLWAY